MVLAGALFVHAQTTEPLNIVNPSFETDTADVPGATLGDAGRRAFVLDDSIKERRGKKVEGSSRHYDHNSGRSIQGHQVLELGIAGERGFIPIDRQIFTGGEPSG